MKRIRLLTMLVTLTWSVLGQTKNLVNVDKAGLALQGHDPVAFFTDNQPVKGRPELQSVHRGATYRFATAANKARFDKDPDKHAPAFGGFCAYGVSKNKLVGVNVEAFQIVEGRLLLQYSKGVRNDFNQDPQGNLRRADQNWPALVGQKGK
jgi:YHS domain-containing protein